MKTLFLSTLALCCFLSGVAQLKTGDITIIPEPLLLNPMPGSFVVNQETTIQFSGKGGETTAAFLNDYLQRNYNFKLPVSPATKGTPKSLPVIKIVEAPTGKKEGYILEVNTGRVYMQGDAPGLFYGLQTLLQLFPVNKHFKAATDSVTQKPFNGSLHLPGVKIQDYPRFAYRGMMLDVSRHFFPPAAIRQFIDMMALYKFNRFHWHLTDDQGWRIEIKKYPRLQEIASTRKETIVGHHRRSNTYDGKPYGGYYTQEEVRDIVKYAADRNITIIPEIEMPGHSQAVLAAYPSFGNTKGPYEVRTTWGISKDVLNPVNDSVFVFLQDVLTEVIDLFPSKYIHIGGDECLKDRWKESAEVQRMIRRLGLKDEHDLQSYFIQRMEKFVNSKGRSIIGWDEILEGGLAPKATVMSWRGEEGGIAAAKQKHDVIMTPNTYLYFDYTQGQPATEPLNAAAYLPLQTVYNYEPLPRSLTPAEQRYIKGVQGNIWTEFIPDQPMLDYMLWPRALALSEIAWAQPSKKNYDRFLQKLPLELARMDYTGVNFRIPEPAGLESKVVTSTTATVTLKPPVKGSMIYYTIDGSQPGVRSAPYTRAFTIHVPENGTATVNCIVVLPNGRISPMYSATYVHKPFLPAIATKQGNKGIRFSLVKTPPSSARQLTETGDSTGLLPAIDIRPLPVKEFGVTFTGLLKVPADDLYELHLNSDDGAIFYIDDQVVVDNDGQHDLQDRSGFIPLRKGLHRIKVQYFNTGSGAWLDAGIYRNREKLNPADVLYTGQ
ncbi:family 20 glycosylhydrolase [Chitinophaga rhizophila]|uniref:beta-N-acetylhexosaminidase n=1 Tax=Chitinophaga rhizophila TaxID=2866212 RepID=A0ABS7GBW8_9BACT|nr:family 20 glycosylhydrolase [Chitinophaga rhizophila]MBW8684028.1 family 20 glycosylhydrolase [Chitinophaga rhizophila]